MTPSPPPEPLEFRGESLTPVSPRPVYHPEPSTIPVLQNQMDPVFNDTSTHMESAVHHQQPAAPTAQASKPSPISVEDDSEASSLYGTNGGEANNENVPSDNAGEPQPVSDEYAMSLENEDDNERDSADEAASIENQLEASISSKPIQEGSVQQPSTADVPTVSAESTSSADQTSPPEANKNDPANGFQAPAIPESQVDFKALLANLTQPQLSAPAPSDPNAPSSSDAATVSVNGTTTSLDSLFNNVTVPSTLPPKPARSESINTEVAASNGQVNPTNGPYPHAQTPISSVATYPPPIIAAGAPGTVPLSASGLPPPPVATFQQAQPEDANSPTSRRREKHGKTPSDVADDDRPWTPNTQKLYDHFLNEERGYVAEAQWEKFPADSRLFVGNLATEKVTKRDLFHVFHKYGRIAQVSIKNAYGFIQFFEAEDCRRALRQEQDCIIRQKRCHLEISRPQTRRGDNNNNNNRRRSRSPDRNRGRNGRDRENRGGRGRDDYRPGRSPSPRGYGNRGDSYRGGADRGRDRYDGGRKRSRSRSPYGRRYRDRSPSPGANAMDDDANLPLPRRNPSQIPEVQFVITDDVDRNFIAYVEKGFKDKGIRTEVLFLNYRLPLAQVVRRQILEGVQAVVRIDRAMQNTGKIPLQVFDRRAGVDNVRFEEYADLTPQIAAELVFRARQTHAAPTPIPQYGAPAPPQGYGMPQYGQPPPQSPYGQPPPQQHPPQQNLSNLIAALDGQGLQKLLGNLQQQQPPHPSHLSHHQPPPTANGGGGGLPPELARLLGGQQQQGYPPHQQPPPPNNPYAGNAAALNSLLASAQRPPPPPQAQGPPHPPPSQDAARNVSSIMEQLAKWRQN